MWHLARGCAVALVFGVGLSLFYDTICIFRILLGMQEGGCIPSRLSACCLPGLPSDFARRPRGKIAIRLHAALLFFFDFFFSFLAGIFFMVFIYWQNDGVFRIYYLLGAALGFFLCRRTVSRLILSVSGYIVFFLRVGFAYVFLGIKLPLRFLFRQAVHLFLLLYLPLYSRWQKSIRLRQSYTAFLPHDMPV